jgi:hypothetical protein
LALGLGLGLGGAPGVARGAVVELEAEGAGLHAVAAEAAHGRRCFGRAERERQRRQLLLLLLRAPAAAAVLLLLLLLLPLLKDRVELRWRAPRAAQPLARA